LVAPKQEYVPERGDVIYLNFAPTKGHEQSGYRPAFVLSPRSYNAKSFLSLLMPITKQQKGYPFEVLLPPELKTQGVILADQIKCLDWKARGVQFVESVPTKITRELESLRASAGG
jgi:mRNA interferase MazF